jgi:hypothetical protein
VRPSAETALTSRWRVEIFMAAIPGYDASRATPMPGPMQRALSASGPWLSTDGKN